ncbi:hypothetical protein AURDEDRAFT_160296 [Auricularia subglabra TFB-10046 SS5]|nr:hypothetical protein AURDEDRAFT_160296 [Auricularia subglabra TFB-10046 SS5]
MTVYFPVDTADRRAVVVLAANKAHSHPSFPSYKLSLSAKAKVEAAIQAMGSLGTTVQTLRTAAITAEITGTNSLGDLHSALDQDRTVRHLIQQGRKAAAPLGTGLTAVFDCMGKQRDTLPASDVYIHEVSDNGIPIIICMLPRLVREIHSARSIVVDMTYKTIAGNFKLWHVVMFSAKYNRRLVVARIFSTHESEEAFLKMWDGLFDCVARVTGRPLSLPVLHKKGTLRVIACDGDPAQASALAKSLHKRHDPAASGLVIRTPIDLLPHFFRTCTVHSDANLDKLAPACDTATMEYLRKFYFMSCDEEVSAFHKFCQISPFPAVRNWYQNKVVHSWYLPSLVQYLSKIPGNVWLTTRGETNLAESSHAATNAVIGTRLQLLVAIDRLHQLDLSLAAGLEREDTSAGIVKNKHNNFQNMLRSNLKRKVRHTERAIAEQQLQKTIGDIDEQMEFHASQRRKLQDEKENLTSTSAGKKTKTRGRK